MNTVPTWAKPWRLGLGLAAVLLIVLVSFASGQVSPATRPGILAPAPGTQPNPAPLDVWVGVYVNRLDSIDIKAGKFSADLWVWFRWKGSQCKPLETFELANGQIEAKDAVSTKTIGDWQYACCRVRATFYQSFDTFRFPFDRHTLVMAIEDSACEEDKVRFLADVDNCGLDPEVSIPGWQITQTSVQAMPHHYRTNYGDVSLPSGVGSDYSRLVLSVGLKHPGGPLKQFLRLFWTTSVAVLVALIALLMKPTELDPRFGLGVGALFAGVASAYITSSALPDSNCGTIVDYLNFVAVAVILVSLIESVLSLRLFQGGHEILAVRLDRWTFGLLLLVYVLASVASTVWS